MQQCCLPMYAGISSTYTTEKLAPLEYQTAQEWTTNNMIYQNSTQHSDVILNVNTSKVQRPYASTMIVMFNPKILGDCSEFLVSLTSDQHLKLAMTFVTKVTIQEHAQQPCQSLCKSCSEHVIEHQMCKCCSTTRSNNSCSCYKPQLVLTSTSPHFLFHNTWTMSNISLN